MFKMYVGGHVTCIKCERNPNGKIKVNYSIIDTVGSGQMPVFKSKLILNCFKNLKEFTNFILKF